MTTFVAAGEQTIAAPILADAHADHRELYLALVRDNTEGVARFLYGVVGDAELAADLSQDVFEQAWRCLGQLRQPAAARSWLFAIAANAARRHVRRTGRIDWLPLDVLAASELPRDVRPDLPDHGIRLEAALGKLSADDRSILLLVGERDLTMGEAALAVGISREAAKKRWQRACARFREAMGEP